MPRLQNLSDHLPLHHFPKLNGPRIGFGVVHPPAHVGVERQMLCPQQKLAFGGNRERAGLQAEIVEPRHALRSRSEDDLAIMVHLMCPESCFRNREATF
jgi:hypothetical protein